MSCGMFDQWELIHTYTRQDAIADGVLVPYTFTYNRRKLDACFSIGLYEKYKAYPSTLRWIAQQGMQLLAQHDSQDNDIRKLRVILKDQIWVILDGDGTTFLRPEDY